MDARIARDAGPPPRPVRRRKYPFDALEVGDVITLETANAAEAKRVYQAASAFGTRHGAALVCRYTASAGETRVWRTA